MRRRALLQGLGALLLSSFVARKPANPYGTLEPGESAFYDRCGIFIRCHADGSITAITAEDFRAAPASGETPEFWQHLGYASRPS